MIRKGKKREKKIKTMQPHQIGRFIKWRFSLLRNDGFKDTI